MTLRKQIRGAIGAVVVLLIFMAAGCGKKNSGEVYEETIASLTDEELFALVETDTKYPLLLVTDMYYEDGNGNQVALWCDIYYPVGDEVRKLGQVESFGTAYPISFGEGGIYTAGGHGMARYVVNEKAGELELAESIQEAFDERGVATYTREDREGMEQITEEEYLTLWEEYGKGQVVRFAYGATGS